MTQERSQKYKKQNQHLTITNLDGLGKMPPNALEFEETVLGAMMLEHGGLLLGMTVIPDPEVFYKEAHQKIFVAIKSLFDISNPVDLLTVTNELRRTGDLEIAGGAAYVVGLTGKVNSAANIEYHIRLMMEAWIKREIIKQASTVCQRAYDDTIDVFELLDFWALRMMDFQDKLSKQKVSTGKELVKETLQQIAVNMENKGMTGQTCGVSDVDAMTGGWQQPDLIILAARPGMGKTAFACNLGIRHPLVVDKKPVMFFSLEMSKQQIMMRLMSAESEISMAQMSKGGVSQSDLLHIQNTSSVLYTDDLIIDDTPGITLSELRAKAISQKLKTPDLSVIIIDYLQLMEVGDNNGNREQEISKISRGLKKLAKELKVPVIALSQLSRSVETRGGDKRPMLSDLRESGAIEQDADVVVFLYRPEYYGIDQFEDGSSTAGLLDVIFAKHRNGPLDTITIGHKLKFSKFHNFQDYQVQPSTKVYHPDKFIESGSIDAFENESMIKDEYQKPNQIDDKAPF